MSEFSPFWSSLRRSSFHPKPKIGLTDPADPRIREAFVEIKKTGAFIPLLVGKPSSTREESIQSSDFRELSLSQASPEFRALLSTKRVKLDFREEDIGEFLKTPLYQGMGLLAQGDLDGLVSGSLLPTAEVVKAALHLVGLRKGEKVLTGQFLIESALTRSADDGPFLFADCAVIPEPSSRMLAAIAKAAADSYSFFSAKQPKVGFLSFSTRGSAKHPLVDRIREAVEIFKNQNPEVVSDGELQVDALLDPDVAKIKKADDSPLQFQANTFIFPTLESGNIGYKLIQRYSRIRIAGPLLWGLQKPVSDLSRGCTAEEIIDSAFCVAKLAARQT